jgi:hypothetical protein
LQGNKHTVLTCCLVVLLFYKKGEREFCESYEAHPIPLPPVVIKLRPS